MKLYYYTSIDTLALILNSKAIRFTRLDLLDDLKEAKPFSEYNPLQHIFASCYTRDSVENIPLWKMYSSLTNGVRLEFDKRTMFQPQLREVNIPTNTQKRCDFPRRHYTALNNSQIINTDYITLSVGLQEIGESIIAYKDVKYDDNFEATYKEHLSICDTTKAENRTDRELSFKPADFGFYKTSYWGFQQESRFLIYTIPFCKNADAISDFASDKMKLKTKYIDVALSDNCIRNLIIRLSPNASEAAKLIIKALVKDYSNIKSEESELKKCIK